MIITVPLSKFNSKAKKLFVENKLKHFGIDYQPNSLMAWNDMEEVEIFNFNKVCKLDNRYCDYDIYIGPTAILIEFNF